MRIRSLYEIGKSTATARLYARIESAEMELLSFWALIRQISFALKQEGTGIRVAEGSP